MRHPIDTATGLQDCGPVYGDTVLVLVGYLVTMQDGHQFGLLGTDKQRELFAKQRNARSIEPMFVRRPAGA